MTERVLASFVGEIDQVPPLFSAVKVDGKRAYRLARKGREVELKAKKVRVSVLELLDFSQTEIRVRVVCSKGTYVRSLARDIGAALDSGGYLTALRRTRVGDVRVEMCYDVSQIEEIVARAVLPDGDEAAAG